MKFFHNGATRAKIKPLRTTSSYQIAEVTSPVTESPTPGAYNLSRSKIKSLIDEVAKRYATELKEFKFQDFLYGGLGGYKDQKSATQIVQQVRF